MERTWKPICAMPDFSKIWGRKRQSFGWPVRRLRNTSAPVRLENWSHCVPERAPLTCQMHRRFTGFINPNSSIINGNWSGRRDLHSRYPAPKAGVLAATLRPDVNKIGAASWYCTTSDSEVARVTAEIASLASYCRVGNWMQRSELHRRRLAYETGLNTDSPCNVVWHGRPRP